MNMIEKVNESSYVYIDWLSLFENFTTSFVIFVWKFYHVIFISKQQKNAFFSFQFSSDKMQY
jgi:hypothetical protein